LIASAALATKPLNEHCVTHTHAYNIILQWLKCNATHGIEMLDLPCAWNTHTAQGARSRSPIMSDFRRTQANDERKA